MQITYFGHSCFLIEAAGKKIILDPFISLNELAEDIDVNQIKVDFILLSHGHQDHVADVEQIYKNSANPPLIIGNFEVVSWFEAKGLKNIHQMNHGGKRTFDFGDLKMVNAVHSSSMPDGSYGGHPAGFVIELDDKTIYYAGDTALHLDMKLIAEDYKIDLAILPIGDNFTMGIDDALKAANFVGTKHIIGMHYDTFPYVKIDHKEALHKAAQKQIRLDLMQIGKTENF